MAKKLFVRFICTIKNTGGLRKDNIPEEIYIPWTQDVPSDKVQLCLLIQKIWIEQNSVNVNFGSKNKLPTIEVLEILTKQVVDRSI